jgi:hypothetical protein
MTNIVSPGKVGAGRELRPLLVFHSRVVHSPAAALSLEPYLEKLWNRKVEGVWQFVFSHYSGRQQTGATLQ